MLKLNRSLSWLLINLMLLVSGFSTYHSTQHIFESQYSEHTFTQVYGLTNNYADDEHLVNGHSACDECLLLSYLHGAGNFSLNLNMVVPLSDAVGPEQTHLPNRNTAAYSSRAPPFIA